MSDRSIDHESDGYATDPRAEVRPADRCDLVDHGEAGLDIPVVVGTATRAIGASATMVFSGMTTIDCVAPNRSF